MKILVICQYYYPEQFRINDICEELVKKGNKVTVLTGLPNYPTGTIPKEYKFFRKRKENVNGVNIIRCWEIGRRKGSIFRILNYFSYMISASIKSLFLQNDYDCIYVYQLSPVTMAIPGIIYKKKNRKKLHLYCLDLWPASLTTGGITAKSIFYKLMKEVSKWIYKSTDTISITSKQFEIYFRQELGLTNQTIIYLPQYAEDIYRNIQQEYIKKESTDLVFAGNIGEAQSVETIILAANELEDESIKIHIVGDGSDLERCKELAKDLKLNNIMFYGKKSIEQMKDFYKMADAMLVTLKKDDTINMTMPGKVQSYMAAGKPIIGAIDGETKNVIQEAKCGYCVEAEEYERLATKMEEFAKDGLNIRKKMAENSYNCYQRNFNKDNFIKKIKNILN